MDAVRTARSDIAILVRDETRSVVRSGAASARSQTLINQLIPINGLKKKKKKEREEGET